MPIISDMEIIKSAIVYGDLDDAMSAIEGRLKSLEYALKRNPSVKVTEYSTFLNSLRSLLEGSISLEQFKETSGKLTVLQRSMDITGDTSAMMDSLYYTLEYSLDRYNVRYPGYDGKRCDDR